MGSGRPDARRRWAALLVGGLVMLVTFVGHDAASSSHAGGDSRWTTYQSLSLLKERTLTLDRWRDVIDRNPIHSATNEHGHLVYTFPWGTAVVIAPVMAALSGVYKLQGRGLEADIRGNFPPKEVENTVASVLVALTAGLLFLIALWELNSILGAAAMALAFAFATSAFSTASRCLWSHGPALLVISAELAILVRARPRTGTQPDRPDRPGRRDRLVPLLGPLFVLAYAVRPTTAVIAVALTVVVAVSHRRWLPLVVVGGALSGAAYFAVNLATYQQLQPDYYNPGRLTGSGTFFEGLAGNLVSPQRGLLVWCPIAVLAAVGVVVAYRRRRFDVLTGGLVVAVVAYWLVISTLDPWWAGFSVGPRLFTDAVPLLFVLALPAVEMLRWRGWAVRGLVAVLLGFSLFTNYRGATRFETQQWNALPVDVHQHPDRIWDWGDLQFLR